MGLFNKKKKVAHTTPDKPRKPKATILNQQRRKGWEPVATPKSAIKSFLLLGLVTLCLGIWWATETDDIRQLKVDYTLCHQIESYDQLEVIPPANIEKLFKASSAGQPVDTWKRSEELLTFDGVSKNYTKCTIEFHLPEDLQPPVLYYYKLTNFLQNHRTYINSFDKDQMLGKAVPKEDMEDSVCKPVAMVGDKIVYPCGMIANSIFNDTFANPVRLSTVASSTDTTPYNMTTSGISRLLDRALYFPSQYTVPAEAGGQSDIVPPPGWAERYPNGYHAGNMFNPQVDEPFMVWMRTAVSDSFAKMALRNDGEVMATGRYRLEIMSHFPAHVNLGTKSIIISTTSATGRRHEFMGKGFLATGAVAWLFVVLLALTLRYRPRRLADHDYLHRSSIGATFNLQREETTGSESAGPMLTQGRAHT